MNFWWSIHSGLAVPHYSTESRRHLAERFWIPAHVAFELMLILSLVRAWSSQDVRSWLLIALASHGIMRLWSAVDFIPKALAFEREDPQAIGEARARRWTHRSLLRLPLDLVTCYAALAALGSAVHAV